MPAVCRQVLLCSIPTPAGIKRDLCSISHRMKGKCLECKSFSSLSHQLPGRDLSNNCLLSLETFKVAVTVSSFLNLYFGSHTMSDQAWES